ncbi:hypothetical protein MHBO_001988 [Bonamia ostreae]|uniref:Uncharacterized protein n=1 Tax=Bonamia ostreae TaxID=126728 RepID=A0ABV2AKX0_9EUKA
MDKFQKLVPAYFSDKLKKYVVFEILDLMILNALKFSSNRSLEDYNKLISKIPKDLIDIFHCQKNRKIEFKCEKIKYFLNLGERDNEKELKLLFESKHKIFKNKIDILIQKLKN